MRKPRSKTEIVAFSGVTNSPLMRTARMLWQRCHVHPLRAKRTRRAPSCYGRGVSEYEGCRMNDVGPVLLGEPIDLAVLEEVAHGRRRVELAPEARRKVREARSVVDGLD